MAMSLSLAVMIISQSIFNGFQKEIARKVFGFWGHIQIADMRVSRGIEPFMIQISDTLKNSIYQIKLPGEKEPAIRHIQSFVVFPTIVASKTEIEGLFLKGVGDDFDWSFFSGFLTKGRVINTSNNNREILISSQTASRLLVDTGQNIILNFIIDEAPVKRKLKIVGIYNTGLVEYDQKWAFVDKSLLQQILQKKSNEVTGLEIYCNNILEADHIKDYLEEELLPSTWYSETIRLKFKLIFEWLSLQNVNKNFILLLILAVCIINMSTTTMILIFERTRMIGVLTVIGMNRWMQQKIFIRYAAKILINSMIIGNIAGYGLCYLQDKFKLIKLNEEKYYLPYAAVDLSLLPILALNIFFFILILVFLMLPTLIVQSIRPVQALKFR